MVQAWLVNSFRLLFRQLPGKSLMSVNGQRSKTSLLHRRRESSSSTEGREEKKKLPIDTHLTFWGIKQSAVELQNGTLSP